MKIGERDLRIVADSAASFGAVVIGAKTTVHNVKFCIDNIRRIPTNITSWNHEVDFLAKNYFNRSTVERIFGTGKVNFKYNCLNLALYAGLAYAGWKLLEWGFNRIYSAFSKL